MRQVCRYRTLHMSFVGIIRFRRRDDVRRVTAPTCPPQRPGASCDALVAESAWPRRQNLAPRRQPRVRRSTTATGKRGGQSLENGMSCRLLDDSGTSLAPPSDESSPARPAFRTFLIATPTDHHVPMRLRGMAKTLATAACPAQSGSSPGQLAHPPCGWSGSTVP